MTSQGSRYATPDYTELLPETTQVSMYAAGRPTESGLAERFIRTLKEEHIDYTQYQDLDDAFEQLAHWLEVEYMTERIHSALGCPTPAGFEAALVINPLLIPA